MDSATPGSTPGASLSILYVVSRWGVSTETFIRREVDAAREAGCRVEVLSLKPPADADGSGLTVRHLPPVAAAISLLTVAAWHPLRATRALARAARRSRPSTLATNLVSVAIGIAASRETPRVDCIHAHFAWAAASAADGVAAMRRTGFSVFVHAFDVFDERYVDAYTADKLRRAVFVAVESNRIKAEVDTRFDCRSEVVRMGVPRSLLTPSSWSDDRSPGLIVSVGSLVPKKGHDVLLRALARLPQEAALLIIGEGPQRAELQSLAEELGITDRVQLTGLLTEAEVVEALDEASVFCLASRPTADGDRDGVPNVLIEAMARGAPCVSTSVSGIPDLLGEGRGVVVVPDDPDALASALAAILDDPDHARSLAEAGYRHVDEQYRTDRNWSRLESQLRAHQPTRGTTHPRGGRVEENRLAPPLGEHAYLQLRSLASALRTEAASAPAGLLVDLGCGAKPYASLFTNPYVGVDVQMSHGKPDCLAVAERLPVRSAAATIVLSTQQLEHVDDPAVVLREAFRVLAPGGLLLLSTHGVWPYHPDPHDLWRWTEEGLRKQVEAAGFEVHRVHRQGGLGAVVIGLSLYPLGGVAARSRLLRPLARCCIASGNLLGSWLDPLVDRMLPRHYVSASYLVVAHRPQLSQRRAPMAIDSPSRRPGSHAVPGGESGQRTSEQEPHAG